MNWDAFIYHLSKIAQEQTFPQYWDEFLKEKYQGGKRKIGNPNSRTRDKFPLVTVSTALKFKQGDTYPIYERLRKEYQQWVKSRSESPKSKTKDKPKSSPSSALSLEDAKKNIFTRAWHNNWWLNSLPDKDIAGISWGLGSWAQYWCKDIAKKEGPLASSDLGVLDPDDSANDHHLREGFKIVDKALSRFKLPESVEVYYDLHTNIPDTIQDKIKDLIEGKGSPKDLKWKSRTFNSFFPKDEIPDMDAKYGIECKVVIPKGTPAAYTGYVNQRSSDSPSLLIPSGHTFQMTKFYYDEDSKKYKAEVSVLPKENKSSPKLPKKKPKEKSTFWEVEQSKNRLKDRKIRINLDIYDFEKEIPDWARSKFGDNPEEFSDTIARISGLTALKDTRVNILNVDDSILLEVDDSGVIRDVRDMSRSIRRIGNEFVLHNDILKLLEDAPKGLGTRIFANQVIEAKRAGVSRIECFAARREGEFIGYKVWPKLGYDGEIPARVLENPDISDYLEEYYPDHTDPFMVSDLLALPDGEDLWDKYGSSFDAVFDLNNEKQLAILQAYLDKKAKEEGKKVEEYLKMGRKIV